jgi:hypothetical protein
MVSITPKSRSISNGTANDATPVEQNFTELYNNDTTLANALTVVENTALTLSQLKGYNTTGIPVYINANSLSVPQLFCSNSQNDGLLIKPTATTVDLNTLGLNGIANSVNLTGSISITAASSTVNGSGTTFSSQFQAGDVIRTQAGQSRRIISVNSNTSLTVESNWASTETLVTFRRGGRAPNTWYHLYAVGNGTTGNFLLSTRNTAASETLSDLPSGYTRQRQLAISVRTDASGNLLPFMIAQGWPFNPLVVYGVEAYNILSGSATSFTVAGTGNYVPPTSRLALVEFGILAAGSVFNQAAIRQAGSTGSGRTLGVSANIAGVNQRLQQLVWLNAQGQFEYSVTNAATVLDAILTGFVITEVQV